jgi:hypothetical protein
MTGDRQPQSQSLWGLTGVGCVYTAARDRGLARLPGPLGVGLESCSRFGRGPFLGYAAQGGEHPGRRATQTDRREPRPSVALGHDWRVKVDDEVSADDGSRFVCRSGASGTVCSRTSGPNPCFPRRASSPQRRDVGCASRRSEQPHCARLASGLRARVDGRAGARAALGRGPRSDRGLGLLGIRRAS